VKIKEFRILKYGPLPDSGRIELGGFNLFFGNNEYGKTLTIDALVKLLLSMRVKDIKEFKNLNRIEEYPEGYLILIDEKGKDIKVPENGNLESVTNLTPQEARNIFVIRNSDLIITSENEFYTRITDRLTGLRTEDIEKMVNSLRKTGKITPQGSFQDIKEEKLKTRIDNSQIIIDIINKLLEEVKTEEFDLIEERSFNVLNAIKKVENRLILQEEARRREMYQKTKDALEKIVEINGNLKTLSAYDKDDELLWRDCENSIKRYSKEIEKNEDKIRNKDEEIKKIKETLTDKELDFENIRKTKTFLEEEVIPEIKNYDKENAKIASKTTNKKLYKSALIFGLILLAISLSGSIAINTNILYIFSFIFFIMSIIFGSFIINIGRKEGKLAEMFERIRFNTSKYDLDEKDIKGILINIKKFYELFFKKENEITKLTKDYEYLKEILKEIKEKDIPEINKNIIYSENNINEIKRKTGAKSFEDYLEKLEFKNSIERKRDEKKSILKTLFYFEEKYPGKEISYWKTQMEFLREYEKKAIGIKYDEKEEKRLKEEKKKLEEERDKINDKMKSVNKSLEGIEKRANDVLRDEEYYYCRTFSDLKEIRKKIKNYIDTNENRKNNVNAIIVILREIEDEEKKKVSELFGKTSFVSDYFRQITDGLYNEVFLQQDSDKIKIRRKDGAILQADKLSGGAFDQLYFSIRLSLGRKLLKDKKGFFIMDDPFIKSDLYRLQRQIDMLKKISKYGWQIVYFSAKKEIKDILIEDINKGNIKCIEVKELFP